MLYIVLVHTLLRAYPTAYEKKKSIVSPKGHLIYFTLLLLQESLHQIPYFTIHHIKIIYFFTPNIGHVHACLSDRKRIKKDYVCLR